MKFFRLIQQSPLAMVGAAILLLWCVVAVTAPWIAPYSPSKMFPELVGNPYPTLAHPLGGDYLGRDMLSRLIWGARTVLSVAPLAVFCAIVLGSTLGVVSAYVGGWVDTVIMRAGDVLIAFPFIILYLLIVSVAGPSMLNIILVIAVSKAPVITRITRGIAISTLQRDFIAAARMRGESALFIMFVEVMPHARGPLMVDGFLRLGYTTIAIGALGFLGIGLPPPNPDWGGMVKESYGIFFVWPHVTIIPALAISSLVIACNFLATGLAEALDDV
jgi:peptide/nickel transport system permease protein